MKKYFVMALAAILPLAFASCGSDSNDSPAPSPTPTTTLGKLDTSKAVSITVNPESASGAVKDRIPENIEVDAENVITIHNKMKDSDPGKGKVLDLTSNLKPLPKKAPLKDAEPSYPWDYEWVIGNANISGNNYEVLGYGTINFASGNTKLTFTFEDSQTASAEGTPDKYDTYNGWEHGAWACRYWVVKDIRVEMTSGSDFTGQWPEANFITIAKDIRASIGDFDDSALLELGKLDYIFFSPAGKVRFFFKNCSYLYNGKWTLKSSDDTFTWELEGTSGNSIINATGNGSITWSGNNGAVKMSVSANKGKYQGFVLFKLTPRS